MHAERSALVPEETSSESPAGVWGPRTVCTVLWKASTIDIVRFDGFVELVMIASAGMHGMSNTRTQYTYIRRALYIRGITTITSLG
jgi:hypothetical protein